MADLSKSASAGLALVAVTQGIGIYGCLHGPPGAAEGIGGDEERARTCRQYVRHADAINIILGVGTSLLARSVAPLLGMLAVSAYMHWMYERALQRGKSAKRC